MIAKVKMILLSNYLIHSQIQTQSLTAKHHRILTVSTVRTISSSTITPSIILSLASKILLPYNHIPLRVSFPWLLSTPHPNFHPILYRNIVSSMHNRRGSNTSNIKVLQDFNIYKRPNIFTSPIPIIILRISKQLLSIRI